MKADYVDRNGTVVTTMWLFDDSTPLSVGRLVADGYVPIANDDTVDSGGGAQVTPIIVGHPLLRDVLSFDRTSSIAPP